MTLGEKKLIRPAPMAWEMREKFYNDWLIEMTQVAKTGNNKNWRQVILH